MMLRVCRSGNLALKTLCEGKKKIELNLFGELEGVITHGGEREVLVE
jgi:hypothetical protein